MKFKFLLFITVALAVAGCKKDRNDDMGGNNGTAPVTPVAPKTYTLTENFDNGSKTAYATGNVTLSSGSWTFNDAVIGNLPADLKNGTQSVRLRNGNIAMNFDVSGLQTLYIKHGRYGTDAASVWQLLMSTDGGTTFTQVGNDINETNTTLVTDSFKITTIGKVRFQIKKNSATAIRINIDDITFKGTGEPGISISTPDTNPVDTTNTSTAAPTRGITLSADAQPGSGDNSNLLFGNPSGADQVQLDNYYLNQGYYAESYSASRSTPNWVSWHLDASNTTNTTSRLDNFAGFSGLPAADYVVQSNSYSGSGFDRGHNCPSADRTSSTNANSATFLMTNMIPQAPNNNQKAWADLENYLRSQVAAGNEVYIIMGSYGTGGVGSKNATVVSKIDNNRVTVPSNVWKVAVIIPAGNSDVLRVTNTTRVIAVNTPNINTIDTDWTKYIVTVRDIEQVTGYNLLSALPQSVQDAVAVKKDTGI